MHISLSMRATVALFTFFLALLADGMILNPWASLLPLFSVLLLLWADKRTAQKEARAYLSFGCQKEHLFLLLLFPLFCLLTLLTTLFGGKLTLFFGGTLPVISQNTQAFFASVILAPLTEELLFRYLLLSLFLSCGEGRAILLSSLLFSLAHADFFQMPYAFTAGLFLGFVAVKSGSFLLPLLFHTLYNTLAFFSLSIPLSLLFYILLPLSFSAVFLFFPKKRISLAFHSVPDREKISPLPLILFACVSLFLAAYRFL